MRHLVLLLALLLTACQPRPAATPAEVETAKLITVTIDSTLDELGMLYQRQGERALEHVTTREQAEAVLEQHDEAWRPAWDAWAEMAAAHRAWKTAVEQRHVVDAAAYLQLLAASWCRLVVIVARLGGALESAQVPFVCAQPEARRYRRLPSAVVRGEP